MTLAEANEQRDWWPWQDLATGLIKRAGRLDAGEDLGLDLDETICAGLHNDRLVLAAFPVGRIPLSTLVINRPSELRNSQ